LTRFAFDPLGHTRQAGIRSCLHTADILDSPHTRDGEAFLPSCSHKMCIDSSVSFTLVSRLGSGMQEALKLVLAIEERVDKWRLRGSDMHRKMLTDRVCLVRHVFALTIMHES
jgi:hypothetical protein